MSLRLCVLNIFLSIICLDADGQIEMLHIMDWSKSSGYEYYIDNTVQKDILNSKYHSFLSSIPFIDKEEPLHFRRLDIGTYSKHADKTHNEMLHYTAYKKGVYIVNLTVSDQLTIRHSYSDGNFSHIPDDQGYLNLIEDEPLPTNEICGLESTNIYYPPARTYKSGQALPPVGIYLEIDHYTYLDFGGDTSAIIEWIEILFAEVAAIYAMDGIDLFISEIFIWEQDDIYDSDFLNPTFNTFTERMAAEGFSGDAAQLITTKPFGRGLAYLSRPCNLLTDSTSLPIGISPRLEKTTSYSGSYDYNRYVLSHEIGHTLGSHHSHDCVWGPNNNTAIDNCASLGCNGSTPVNGGTIMSYCNSTAQGINFANGLGSEPAQRIKNIIASTSCLFPDSMCNEETTCDDGDPCTENDLYDENCNCVGSLLDTNGNGVCDIIDSCIEDGSIVSTISNDTIIAVQEFIAAHGPLNANSKVIFSAGEDLILNPGFEVSYGTTFQGIVMDCFNE